MISLASLCQKAPQDICFSAEVVTWPLKVPFVISRSSRAIATVVEVRVQSGDFVGRGECQPNSRYGYDAADVVASITGKSCSVGALDAFWHSLPSPARNGVECALLDLAAKISGKSVCDLLSCAPAQPHGSVTTISLGRADEMAKASRDMVDAGYDALKLKLGAAETDAHAMQAVRQAVGPDISLVADANEGWTEEALPHLLSAAESAGISIVEQPLPAGHRVNYRQMITELGLERLMICADESFTDAVAVADLAARYHCINIKLDKVGGLRAALQAAQDAADHGLSYMVGCMLGSSLAMAPAQFLVTGAVSVDLDGPFLLAQDQAHGLFDRAGRLSLARKQLWG